MYRCTVVAQQRCKTSYPHRCLHGRLWLFTHLRSQPIVLLYRSEASLGIDTKGEKQSRDVMQIADGRRR